MVRSEVFEVKPRSLRRRSQLNMINVNGKYMCRYYNYLHTNNTLRGRGKGREGERSNTSREEGKMELKFVTPISLCVFIMEEGGVDDPIFFLLYVRKRAE